MIKRFFSLLLLGVSTPLLAYGPYSAEVIEVVNAEIVKIKVEIWPGQSQVTDLHLKGLTTPGKSGSPDCEIALSRQAVAFTEAWLSRSDTIEVSEIKNATLSGNVMGRISLKNAYLGDALIAAELGAAYYGGPSSAWCSD